MATFALLKKILRHTPASHTVCFRGDFGIGKTEVLRQISKESWNLPCVELQGSQLADVGDLIGLMRINAETGHSEWVPPYWYPTNGKPICLFLDELNRATSSIKRSMMQLANDHKILSMALPEGSRIVVAINPSADGKYDVEEFDPAENDRFVIYDVTPSVDEWIDWATKTKHHPIVIQYIVKHPNDLDAYGNAKNARTTSRTFDGKLTSRRTWTKFNNYIQAALAEESDIFSGEEGKRFLEEVAVGYVGRTVAGNFASFWAQQGEGLDPMEIINAFSDELAKKIKDTCKKSKMEGSRLGASVIAFIDGMSDKLSVKKDEYTSMVAENWYKFLKACTPEVRTEICTNGVETARANKKAWVKCLSKNYPELVDLYITSVSNEVEDI